MRNAESAVLPRMHSAHSASPEVQYFTVLQPDLALRNAERNLRNITLSERSDSAPHPGLRSKIPTDSTKSRQPVGLGLGNRLRSRSDNQWHLSRNSF